MTNTIPNVPRELKPCPFCGGEPNLTTADYVYDDLTPMPVVECKSCSAWVQADDWNTRAPSPAGVEGLEVVGVRVTSDGFGSYIADSAMGMPATFPGEAREPLCRLSSASSIIIGLREKIERLQFSLEVAKTDELSAAVYAETESIKHSLWDTEKERDQQAQRIGELEGLLRSCLPALSDGGCAALANRIDAALSAGKDSDQ